MNHIVKTQAGEAVQQTLFVINTAVEQLNNSDSNKGAIYTHHASFASKIKFAQQATGWASGRIVALREEDDKPISVRAVTISYLVGKEDAATVVFEDFEKITAVLWKEDQPPLSVNKSTTRLYQDPQYLGIRSDGSQRSKAYVTMVGRRSYETLAEDICQWVINGNIPGNWVADPKHQERYATSDKAYFDEKAKQEAMKNI